MKNPSIPTHEAPAEAGPPVLLDRLPAGPVRAWQALVRGLEAAQPLALLLARVHIAQVFLPSGWTKVQDWGTTLALFTDEYRVPWLSPPLAALLGTGGELVLPVLLLLGLGGRFAALGLFCVNLVAVISLPELSAAAEAQHRLWGSLLLGLALWGPGPWALERHWPRRPAPARSV